MKKVIITILAILYIVVTSGVVVSVHYCMGDVAAVEYGYNDEDACGTCGMKSGENNCCHSEVSFVKIQDSHQLGKQLAEITNPPIQNSSYYISLSESVQGKNTFRTPAYLSPPNQRVNSVYLHTSVFRI